MQVCTLLQTDKHASTPPLSCLQAGCPSCRPTNSVKALKALLLYIHASLFAVQVEENMYANKQQQKQKRKAETCLTSK